MGKIVVQAIDQTYKKCPDVWNSKENKETAKSHLLSNGSYLLLNKDDLGKAALDIAGALAVAIHTLERFDPSEDLGTWSVGSEKERLNIVDVLEGCERSLLKFYSTRLPCSCLDSLYAKAKSSQAKTGLCFHCKKRKDRSELLVCSKCRNQQYCSKEW